MRRIFRMASVVVVLAAVAAFLYVEDGRVTDLFSVTKLDSEQGAQDATGSGATNPPPTVAGTTTLPPLTPINALLVGDSVLAELRWFEQATLSLQGFTYTLDAESCRALLFDSCGGREGRTPNSATSVVQGFAAPVDVVVLVGGYHAAYGTIKEELQWFAAAVAAKNAKLVILTFAETMAVRAPGSGADRSVYADYNFLVRAMAVEGLLGDVTIADWNLFSSASPHWFRSDGLHTTIVGTLAMGWFISATLASLYNNPCPMWGTYPCVPPEICDPTVDWLAQYGVPYTDMHCYEDGASRVRVCEQDRNL